MRTGKKQLVPVTFYKQKTSDSPSSNVQNVLPEARVNAESDVETENNGNDIQNQDNNLFAPDTKAIFNETGRLSAEPKILKTTLEVGDQFTYPSKPDQVFEVQKPSPYIKKGYSKIKDLSTGKTYERPYNARAISMLKFIQKPVTETKTTVTKDTAKKQETKHEFSSTQVDIDPNTTKEIQAFSKRLIDEKDLAEDGREDKSHATAKYGLETNNVEDVRPLVEDMQPFTATLGKTFIFDTNPDFDVVNFEIHSPELLELNKRISELPNQDSHPKYTPHVAIAYVKKGEGQKYVGNTEFEGKEIKFDGLTFSDKNREKVFIPFKGQVKTNKDNDDQIVFSLPTKHTETVTFKGVTVEVEPIKFNSKRLNEIQAKTISEVVSNPKKFVDAYFDKFGNKNINSDLAKELFAEYNDDPLANSQAVHKASALVSNLLFKLRLKELPPNSVVMLTAGGAASGKTFATKTFDADLIYDSVMRNAGDNRQTIDQVLMNQHLPVIVYVVRPIKEATLSNIQRQAEEGRVVPITNFSEGHFQSQQAFINDTNNYAKSKNVEVHYLLNRQNQGAIKISFEQFKQKAYNNFEDVLQTVKKVSYDEIKRNAEKYDPRIGDALENRELSPRSSKSGLYSRSQSENRSVNQSDSQISDGTISSTTEVKDDSILNSIVGNDVTENSNIVSPSDLPPELSENEKLNKVVDYLRKLKNKPISELLPKATAEVKDGITYINKHGAELIRRTQGGKGMKIDYTITNCELGKMLVARTEKGVCAVTFGDDENFLTEKLFEEYPQSQISKNETNLKEYVEAILQNLAGKNKQIALPIDVRATAFQMRVWDALRKIPFGETLSYKQVAENLGNPKAVRAVARACATNKVAVVIPCHRVVGSDGKLSGYRWGIERKQKLIDAEKGERG